MIGDPVAPQPPISQRSFALSYVECRARFRLAAARLGATLTTIGLGLTGPFGESLAIDAAYLGPAKPRRALLVMSGTHGIEGFAGSAQQVHFLDQLREQESTDGILLIHAVNPWGMAHWRRANENNVDLNRNWLDFADELPQNSAYAAVHDLLCPGGPQLPNAEDFLSASKALVAKHGITWMRQAVSGGQYSHPDGLYFGGAERQASTTAVAELVSTHLRGCETFLGIDLHTGHGEYGTYTILSREPLGSASDAWVRSAFDTERVETTVGNAHATLAPKVGQLCRGVAGMLADAGAEQTIALTLEIGTRSETRVIIAERAEHWVHRFGDLSDPDHREAIWTHRICSIPDNAVWEANALAHAQTVLGQAVSAAFPNA